MTATTRDAPHLAAPPSSMSRALATTHRLPQATALAYQRVRDLVVSGRLAPGAPLVELDLCQRLGVSRTPVRAALQRLQQEGFVAAVRAGRMARAVVAPLTSGDMLELFGMVGALEAAAARLAAALGAGRRERLANEMAEAKAGIRAAGAARPPDLARARELHAHLHRAFSTAGGGPRLRAELDLLQAQAARYERVYPTAMACGLEEAASEHEAIADAIRRGDPAGAEDAVVRHWEGGARRYRDVMTILGERGHW